MNHSEQAVMALSSAPDESVAQQLAHDLVKQQLAACVSIVPKVTSVYQWQGDIQTDSELLLVIKTCADKVPVLKQWLDAHHPYEVPELICCNISDGNDSYLTWLTQTLNTHD